MSLGEDAGGKPVQREVNDRLKVLRPDSEAEPRLMTRGDHAHAPVRSPDRRGRLLRRLAIAVVALVIFAIASTIIVALWARHAMHAALPTVDGTLAVSGLNAPVTVDRNAQGVPSIHAASMEDLLFAQGYVTAQDRLWQMDVLRRHAAGELAEILGPGLVAHDKMQRYLQFRAAADRAAASLPAARRREMEAYARGVNAFIDSHRDTLPLEFHLLHYTPRPWTPRDSLLVSLIMWQDLSTSFIHKLDREELAKHLAPPLLADLYPVGSWRDHPPGQAPPDLTTPHEIEEIPLDATQSKLQQPDDGRKAGELLALSDLQSATCDDCRAGSNNWAISGARSASGKPMVSNDMHLSLSVPDIWYEAALHIPPSAGNPTALDVTGFTLPGVPWVLVGRNAHVAWGFTNLGGDVQDVYVEHLRGSGPTTEYEKPGGTWAPVTHRTEQIIVRGGHNVTLDVLTVSHAIGTTQIETPIISPVIPAEKRILSLAWSMYDPSCVDSSFYSADSAADGASLVASLADFGGPSLNLVYGDDQGHIGYHAVGRIPIRGPAVQHPRAEQQFVLPSPEPDSDEEEDSAEQTATQSGAAQQEQENVQPEPAQSGGAGPKIPLESTASYTMGSPISPVPVDALDQSQIWSGYIPYNALPAIQDPQTGIVATANARIATDDYPYALTDEWIDPYRIERIYRLLGRHTGWTPQQMLAVQMDQHSEFDLLLAQRLAYAVDHSSAVARDSDGKRLQQAADLLRTWHGDMAASSPAAAIVAATRSDLWTALLVPHIVAHDHSSRADAFRVARLYSWGEDNTALEDLLQHTPSHWLPQGVANWDDFLTIVLRQGLDVSNAPGNLAHWQYGSIHRIEVEHPLFAGHHAISWLLGAATGTGAQPAGGDMTTIDAIGRSFGPSERFTADLSSPSATTANIVTGESGNVSSDWYLDEFPAWLQGTTFALPLQDTTAAHSLTLVPAQ